MRFGLNRTFFEPALQVARMDDLGIDRTVLSLATPLINYYLDAPLAVAGCASLQRRVRGARDG